MNKPTIKKEREHWKAGKLYVGGIDEAGRGAWAGPVVAAVVILPPSHVPIKEVNDSKLLSPSKRAELYEVITEAAIDFGIGVVDHTKIDEVGILEATKLACTQALELLETEPDFIFTDALDLSKHTGVSHEAVIHGDQIIYSISCASILAKVTRDNLMSNLAGQYQKYHFFAHKGYGTKLHQQKLAEYGISDIHRRSYKPIAKYL